MFSKFSKEAFNLLRRVYKFEQLKEGTGQLSRKSEMEKMKYAEKKRLIVYLLRETLRERCMKRLKSLVPFPKLGKPSIDEMKAILKVITINKVLAADLYVRCDFRKD